MTVFSMRLEYKYNVLRARVNIAVLHSTDAQVVETIHTRQLNPNENSNKHYRNDHQGSLTVCVVPDEKSKKTQLVGQ